ncbi:hypothetical protein J6I75_06420 [Pseudidiomarina sp. 1APP75-27a]|uniref:hypothetical protein n=1 Tax=Pseudidiomarina terrestris TaxID=2820060 RepID=UPI002B05C7F5|nr:hypothetical protein [Pseudidiomarina sp. 1APP75-27a]MEA3587980.1 hypothetical protein [Pseudidiomarina sp. 1APP75-27a]
MNNIIEDEIRCKCTKRIAEIFRVDKGSLGDDTDLTKLCETQSARFWKRNVADKVLDDIRDAAGKESLKLLNSGEFEVRTFADYVRFMQICYEENPRLVQIVIGEV